MIIDSHAHYAHGRFDNEFPCLCVDNETYSVCSADRKKLLDEMKSRGIIGSIEASIGFNDIEKQMQTVRENSSCMWSSLGVHPTRCIHTAWKNRKKLTEYAEKYQPIAVGETGLDYHYPRGEQHRLLQKMWFVYQIKLAKKLGLPLILHIRDADADALKILKKYRSQLLGGVAHCFSGDAETAMEYISLGFAVGIGGKLLCDDEKGRILSETVKNIPLSSIVVETDAPFVLPDIGEIKCSRNQRRKLCNSSLILPQLVRRIAELREEDCEYVEEAIFQNTVRVFSLTFEEGMVNE